MYRKMLKYYWSLDEQDFSDLDWLILDYNF